MGDMLRSTSLFAATLTMGLIAGLFYAFSCAVMPGLARAEDRTLVDTMRQINIAIINGWFMLSFIGALVLTLVAAALHLPDGKRAALPWIIAAAVVYLVTTLVVTGVLNVPLNNQLEAQAAQGVDFAAIRAQFEATWVRWNLVRAVGSTVAFGCLIRALTA
jgi:uncharacterized membrane protein